jgi:hypothetical protein
LRAAAEGELAVDDGRAQAALGSVVGRLDIVELGERPQRRPELEQVLRECPHVALPLPGRAPHEQRPHLRLDRGDALLERLAIAVLLELLPSVEDIPGDLQPVEPERLLRAEAQVGVEGELATQMRPAHLPPLRLEAVVRAEAVGANNAGEPIADEAVQVLLATVGRDPQHRRLFAEGAPKRARLAAQVPARLVNVERPRGTRLLEQLVIDRLERLGGASEDRVDGADRDRAAEQLLHQLDQLPPRETIPNRERRDRRLQLRPEAAARNTGRQLRADRAAAGRATDALQPVLADLDRQRW